SAFVAIDSLSADIPRGQFSCIVGPSGAGKTTLLRILSGLLTPASGGVYIGGQRIDGVPDGMAMVFQDYSRSLLPWLSVAKNVAFPLKRAKGSRAEQQRLVQESLDAVGLTGFEDR